MRILVAWLVSLVYLMAADATIDVIKTSKQLPTIAIEDSSINYTQYISKRFHKVLVGDVHVLSQFKVDDTYVQNDFVSDTAHSDHKKVDFIIKYRLKQNSDAQMYCDVKLIDTNAQRELFSKHYKVTKEDLYVFLAHEIAYDINTFFGFEAVDWIRKRVIFSRYISPRESEIVISDYSLSYQKVIIRGGLNVFPKWADDKQRSFYYTTQNEVPTLYYYNMITGETQKIVQSDGMLVCSDVNQNFDKLLLTMAPDGQADIYIYDTKSKTKKQITNYSGIDVNGQFLDNDTRVAFVSDRLGYPNVFAQTIGQKDVEQLVYYGKNNNSCSAHDNYLVYTSRESDNEFSQNSFNLHLISTKTEFVRHLTATGVNQYPRFSNDGSAILFIKHFKRQSALGVIRLQQNKSFLFPLKVGKIQSIDW